MAVIAVIGDAGRREPIAAAVQAAGHTLEEAGVCEVAVLLLDQDPLGALAAAREAALAERYVACPSRRDVRVVRKLIDGGADGVVWDEDVGSALGATVAAVLAGQICVPRDTRRRLQRPELTTREKQVLSMVVMGQTNAEIAARLYLSEATVKSHLSAVFRKLGVSSRAEAARIAADPTEGFGTGVLSIL